MYAINLGMTLIFCFQLFLILSEFQSHSTFQGGHWWQQCWKNKKWQVHKFYTTSCYIMHFTQPTPLTIDCLPFFVFFLFLHSLYFYFFPPFALFFLLGQWLSSQGILKSHMQVFLKERPDSTTILQNIWCWCIMPLRDADQCPLPREAKLNHWYYSLL